MRARYSAIFGEEIKDLLDRRGMSLRAAAIKVGGGISPSWWSEMRRGRIPSPETLKAIQAAFPNEDLGRLWIAAGYTADGADIIEYLSLDDVEMAEKLSKQTGVSVRDIIGEALRVWGNDRAGKDESIA